MRTLLAALTAVMLLATIVALSASTGFAETTSPSQEQASPFDGEWAFKNPKWTGPHADKCIATELHPLLVSTNHPGSVKFSVSYKGKKQKTQEIPITSKVRKDASTFTDKLDFSGKYKARSVYNVDGVLRLDGLKGIFRTSSKSCTLVADLEKILTPFDIAERERKKQEAQRQLREEAERKRLAEERVKQAAEAERKRQAELKAADAKRKRLAEERVKQAAVAERKRQAEIKAADAKRKRLAEEKVKQAAAAERKRQAELKAAEAKRKHKLVRQAQTALRELGLYEGAIDGALGPKSSAGLGRWLSEHGYSKKAQLTDDIVAELKSDSKAHKARLDEEREQKRKAELARKKAEEAEKKVFAGLAQTAKLYLNDVYDFLKANPTTPMLLDASMAAVSLKNSLEARSSKELKVNLEELQKIMSSSEEYSTYAAQLAQKREEQKAELARKKAEEKERRRKALARKNALAELQTYKKLLSKLLVESLSKDATLAGKLVPIIKTINGGLKSSDGDQVLSVVGTVKKQIAANPKIGEPVQKEIAEKEARKAAEEEKARRQAEERERKRQAELARKKAQEEERRQAELARKKAEEAELARKKAQEEERRQAELARKKAEEAELARKKAEAEEKARKLAEEEARKRRANDPDVKLFASLAPEARLYLVDVQKFLKEHPGSPILVDASMAVISLKESLEGESGKALQASLTELRTVTAASEEFTEYAERLAKKREQERTELARQKAAEEERKAREEEKRRARERATAIADLNSYKALLGKLLVESLSTDAALAKKLAPIVKAVNEGLKSSVGDQLLSVVEAIRKQILANPKVQQSVDKAIARRKAEEQKRKLQIQEGIDAYNKKDYVTTLRIFEPLAAQRDPVGQLYLGKMYYHGDSHSSRSITHNRISQNTKKAAALFLQAAEQGNMDAQFNMGRLIERGELGLPQDFRAALKWFTLSAEQGNGNAASFLGDYYSGLSRFTSSVKREGVKLNLATAKKWYLLAAERLEYTEVDYQHSRLWEIENRIAPEAEKKRQAELAREKAKKAELAQKKAAEEKNRQAKIAREKAKKAMKSELVRKKAVERQTRGAEEALKLSEEKYGKEHKATGKALFNLALLYHRLWRHEEAERLYSRALLIDDKFLDPHDLDIAENLVRLQQINAELNNFRSAIRHYKRFVKILEKTLGESETTEEYETLRRYEVMMEGHEAYENAKHAFDNKKPRETIKFLKTAFQIFNPLTDIGGKEAGGTQYLFGDREVEIVSNAQWFEGRALYWVGKLWILNTRAIRGYPKERLEYERKAGNAVCKSANKGDRFGTNLCGYFLAFRPKVFAPDPESALQAFRNAASRGVVHSYIHLGELWVDTKFEELMFKEIEDHQNMDKKMLRQRADKKGIKWYNLAAEKGSSKAMYRLGTYYEGKSDMASAMNWYRKTAEHEDFYGKKGQIEITLYGFSEGYWSTDINCEKAQVSFSNNKFIIYVPRRLGIGTRSSSPKWNKLSSHTYPIKIYRWGPRGLQVMVEGPFAGFMRYRATGDEFLLVETNRDSAAMWPLHPEELERRLRESRKMNNTYYRCHR